MQEFMDNVNIGQAVRGQTGKLFHVKSKIPERRKLICPERDKK